ncbi:sporulation integral membrane protein YtvI [Bacillus sp. JRC01]|nr:sporulation integral membrane protein YtvI [Bacillus sp. JRC01]
MARFKNKKFLIYLGLFIVLILLCLFILPISLPLILAFMTALILEPSVRMLQGRFDWKRKVAVMSIFILFLLLLGITSYFVTTKVVGEGVKLVENTPHYISKVGDIWEEYEDRLLDLSKDLPDTIVKEFSNDVQHFLDRSKSKILQSFNLEKISAYLTYIPNFLVSLLVFLIALFLFMLDLPRIKHMIYSHLTDATAEKVNFMISRMTGVFFGFFKAQFLVSILIFIVTLIGLLIITPEVAIIMSVIIWFIDFLPLVGSIAILGPWALYHFITGDISLGTQLSVLAAILLIIRRTVEPKVMGTHIGLSPLATLIAMYLGLKLFGVMGFVIGPFLLILFNSAKEAGIIKLNFKL